MLFQRNIWPSAEQETSSSKWKCLHFNSEGGGYVLLQNVGLSLNYMALQPRGLFFLLKFNYQNIFSFNPCLIINI
jgi:hypothetical protein